MNANDSFLVPLIDAGRLSGLTGGPLGPRFRFWRDQSGKRHVFSVYEPDEAPDYPDALAVVARRTPAGSIAIWAGAAGEAARAAAERFRAEEIHICVLTEDAAESLVALRYPERVALPNRENEARRVAEAPARRMATVQGALAACLGPSRAGRRAA
ncbi:MAG: hypothetical protein B7X99_06340 [Rhizobiales bacterium 17-65-6]|nr:MAG: hypothetical protein B7X99_06340 [Rhizobiales bacterium 17-65-6]